MRSCRFVSAVALATIVSGCGGSGSGSETHYSAASFRACAAKHHLNVTSPGHGVVVVMRPSFEEWVQFYPSARFAARMQSSIRHNPSPMSRVRRLRQALRGRRANVLVFAAATKDWRSLLDLCLKR